MPAVELFASRIRVGDIDQGSGPVMPYATALAMKHPANKF